MSDTLVRTAQTGPEAGLDSVTEPTQTRVERVGPDCYVVLARAVPVGYIDVAGPVFVALHGRHYHRAVEVGQARDLDNAAEAVLAAHIEGGAR